MATSTGRIGLIELNPYCRNKNLLIIHQVIAKSNFFEWSVKKFRDEMLTQKTFEDNQKRYEEMEWRSQRNSNIKLSAERFIESNPGFRFERELLLQKNVDPPNVLMFDPYQHFLVAADNQGVWFFVSIDASAGAEQTGGWKWKS